MDSAYGVLAGHCNDGFLSEHGHERWYCSGTWEVEVEFVLDIGDRLRILTGYGQES